MSGTLALRLALFGGAAAQPLMDTIQQPKLAPKNSLKK
jgi:hypothetical protein